MLIANVAYLMDPFLSEKALRFKSLSSKIAPSELERRNFRLINVVPHHGSIYEIICYHDPLCSYIQELFDRIGKERFVQTRYGVFARDDEVLALWNLAYNEEAERASADLYWRSVLGDAKAEMAREDMDERRRFWELRRFRRSRR